MSGVFYLIVCNINSKRNVYNIWFNTYTVTFSVAFNFEINSFFLRFYIFIKYLLRTYYVLLTQWSKICILCNFKITFNSSKCISCEMLSVIWFNMIYEIELFELYNKIKYSLTIKVLSTYFYVIFSERKKKSRF